MTWNPDVAKGRLAGNIDPWTQEDVGREGGRTTLVAFWKSPLQDRAKALGCHS